MLVTEAAAKQQLGVDSNSTAACGGSMPAPVAAALQQAARDGIREWRAFEASVTSSRVS